MLEVLVVALEKGLREAEANKPIADSLGEWTVCVAQLQAITAVYARKIAILTDPTTSEST